MFINFHKILNDAKMLVYFTCFVHFSESLLDFLGSRSAYPLIALYLKSLDFLDGCYIRENFRRRS